MANEKSSRKDGFLQALKFTLFSISAGLIQIGSFTLMTEVLPRSGIELPYWVRYLVSLILSVLWNFTLNRKYTFKSASNVPIAMLKVAAYYAVFTPLSTWLGHKAAETGLARLDAAGLMQYKDFLDYGIEAVTMLANFITEFIYDKYVVFKDSAEKKTK